MYKLCILFFFENKTTIDTILIVEKQKTRKMMQKACRLLYYSKNRLFNIFEFYKICLSNKKIETNFQSTNFLIN